MRILIAMVALALAGAGCLGSSGDGADDASGGGGGSSAPPACPDLSGAGAAEVTVFRTERGGECVAPADLVRYRCTAEPGAVPVLAVGGQRFLGGPYAIRTSRLPAAARPVGVAGATTVYQSDRDPRMVWTRRGPRTDRWLFLPKEGGGQASFIADSVLLGAAPEIEAALTPRWQVGVDAEVSRPTTDAVAIIDDDPGDYADAVVVQLGTNDGGLVEAYGEHVGEIADRLDDARLLLWLTIAEVRSYYDDDNDAMRAALAAHPNTAVADWNRVYPPEDVSSDGLHLGPTAAATMARLVRSYLDPWRAAIAGRGPDRCGAAVLAAV